MDIPAPIAFPSIFRLDLSNFATRVLLLQRPGLSVCLSAHLSVRLSAHLFLRLPAHLSSRFSAQVPNLRPNFAKSPFRHLSLTCWPACQIIRNTSSRQIP